MHAKLPEHDVQYENDRFVIRDHDYNIQFFPFYNARLKQMESLLRQTALDNWPDTELHQISDLAEKHEDEDDDTASEISEATSSQRSANIDADILHGKSVVVFGTLFKKMQQQPNILKELDDEKKMISASGDSIKTDSFISDTDKLYLQAGDESIELKEGIEIAKYCTGICLALKGHINQNGSGFIVEDISFPGMEINKAETRFMSDSYYIAIVCGLGFSKNMAKNRSLTQSLNVLHDLVTGFTDSKKKIINLIIAGNSVGENAASEEKVSDNDKTPAWNRKIQSYTVDSVKMLDKFLASIGQVIHVDIIPGPLDPCNHLWPQQPMHPCLFPLSYKRGTVRSVTNPHRATYYGLDLLGTSGQNIEAFKQYTNQTGSINIMKQMMAWGHVAPNCPDTLHSYPFKERDPFVLESLPDVYFVGNQPEFKVDTFQTKNGKDVKLLAVPSFETQRIVALVDLKTLNCQMINLN